MRRAIAALVLLLGAGGSGAQELIPFLEDRQLGVAVTGTPLPPTLSKDLKSGLTNRILMRIVLTDERSSRRGRNVQLTIRYDLWEEAFAVTTAVDATPVDTRKHASLADVLAYLAKVRLPRLFATGDLDAGEQLTLHADVLFNPIERERMDAIRKWVAQNSVQTPIDSTAGPSLSDAIFNRIFEQYASGSNVAAVWRQTLDSQPFTVQALSDAQR